MNAFDSISQLASVSQLWGAFPSVLTDFQLRDAADILIVAAVIYFVIIFIRQTRSFFIFNSVIFLVIIDFLSNVFNLTLTREIFEPLLAFFLFIFVIVFQSEIRRFFKWFAAGKMIELSEAPASNANIVTISKAVFDMAKKKIGALIVFPGEYPLDGLLEGGIALNGNISYPLIISIFDDTSPGHDGAMLIDHDMIEKFALHLPLAEDFKSTAVGTRHRAAVGITERTDALVVVVSEERGTVSIAEKGALRSVVDEADLISILNVYIKATSPAETYTSFWHYFFVRNLYSKIASLALACVLWFVFVFQTGTVQQQFNVPIEFRYLPKNLTVSDANVDSIEVTLSGNNHDISNLDPTTLKVVADLSGATQGEDSVTLDPNDFTVPQYLTVVDYLPKEVYVDVATTSATSTQ